MSVVNSDGSSKKFFVCLHMCGKLDSLSLCLRSLPCPQPPLLNLLPPRHPQVLFSQRAFLQQRAPPWKSWEASWASGRQEYTLTQSGVREQVSAPPPGGGAAWRKGKGALTHFTTWCSEIRARWIPPCQLADVACMTHLEIMPPWKSLRWPHGACNLG